MNPTIDGLPQPAIRPLRPADGPACDAVILSLPYHVGHASGRAECVQVVRAIDGLVALVRVRLAGFLTIERHYETTAEITWMAVQAGYRGQGIGRALIAHLVQVLRNEGRSLLLVTTLAESVDEGDVVDSSARTRAFYRAVGFLPARGIPLWGVPALLLAMPLAPIAERPTSG